jgi:hypothetical protein
MDRSLFAEALPNLKEAFDFFGRNVGSETQEHLEGRMARTVEELKTERLLPVEMAGLFHGEDRSDLSPANVHVQGFSLDVEEIARRAETPELAICLQGGCSVGDDHMHPAERLKIAERSSTS